MSARMLQRAQAAAAAAAARVDVVVSSNADSGDSDGGDETRGGGPVGNPFDLLGLQDEDDETDVVVVAEDVERESHQQSASGSASNSATAVPGASSSSKSRRKKSRSKQKGKKEASAGGERPLQNGEDESVDKLFERLGVGVGVGVGVGQGSSSISNGTRSAADDGPNKLNMGRAREFSSLLGVDLKHLRAEGELRRIFGSKVINSAERRGGEGVRSQRRQGVGGRRTGRGGPLRKSVLVVPREHWARWDGRMTMECIKVEGPIHFFRYQYSASYEEVQKRFESCVASHDPNTIVMLLHSHPYHVDSLLALAEVYKQMGEHQQSANLVEQCLYALECAWHPWFQPTSGTCRLEFQWNTNKALLVALFRHMQHLGRRGCHRTALEVCKLILALDPTDPLGDLFCIDYFALRAEQYEWLERFVDGYEADKSRAVLPNFAFSMAVARFHLEGQQQQHQHQLEKSSRTPAEDDDDNVKNVKTGDKNNNSSSNSSDSKGRPASSATLLQRALMLHPSALKKIIVRASIKEDQSWERILADAQFCDEAAVGGPTLEHLIDIYVERGFVIWRAPEIQEWLKEAATKVAQISGQKSRHHSISDSERAKWESVRNGLFPSDENEYSHLHISEYSDSTSSIMPEDMAQLNFHPHGGGLAREDMMLREAAGLPVDEDHLQELAQLGDFPGRNALLVFLQSLIPRMDYGEDASADDNIPTLLDDDSNGNNN